MRTPRTGFRARDDLGPAVLDESRRQPRRWRHVLAALLGSCLALLIVTGGIVVGLRVSSSRLRVSPPSSSLHTTSAPAVALPSPSYTTAAPDSSSDSRNLRISFAQLQAALGGRLGVTLMPIGGSGPPMSFGDWVSGPAWSTMKVPLAIAALRQGDSASASEPIKIAITQSDNDAADAIWRGLGPPDTAADKVDAVLQEAGDPTRVQSYRSRPEYSAFGQTVWSLENQTRFLAAAACDNRSAAIFDLMGQIASDQLWGLGTIPGARFKGGWGPLETGGGYLVRQLGVIDTNRGQVAAAIAAQLNSGTFADGVAQLTQLGRWLGEHSTGLPAGRCPG